MAMGTDDMLAILRLPTLWEVLALAGGYALFWAVRFAVIRPLTSPLRNLQCPPGGEGFTGHWPDMLE
jgi:hypothetical protein